MLPGADRPVAVAAGHADPGRAHPAAPGRPRLDLRLLLLGARHVRPAFGLPRPPAGPPRGRGAPRDWRSPRPDDRPAAPGPPEADRDQGGRALGARPPGG